MALELYGEWSELEMQVRQPTLSPPPPSATSPLALPEAKGLPQASLTPVFRVQVVRKFIEPGHTVVEAGVHIGSLMVPMAQLAGPNGRLIGFEPQRVLYQIASANVAINGLWNVQLRNAGRGQRKRHRARITPPPPPTVLLTTHPTVLPPPALLPTTKSTYAAAPAWQRARSGQRGGAQRLH